MVQLAPYLMADSVEAIKHNKDLFESLDDPYALLEKLHIY